MLLQLAGQSYFNYGKCKRLHTGHGNLDLNYKMGEIASFEMAARGFEPAFSRLRDRRSNRYATAAHLSCLYKQVKMS